MNRILQAILGSEAYVGGRGSTKKKEAVPVVLPEVSERRVEVKPRQILDDQGRPIRERFAYNNGTTLSQVATQ